LGGINRIARVFALGREGQEEILAALQALTLQDGEHVFVGRPRVCRAFEDDQLALAEVLGDHLRGIEDVGQVGIAMGVERRRHADQDGVHLRQPRKIGRRVEAAGRQKPAQVGRRDVLDVALPPVQHLDFFLIHVESGDDEALF
jgi:hypothetical protein